MFVRRRTDEIFFIGRTLRPSPAAAREAVEQLLAAEDGERNARAALAAVLPAGAAAEMPAEDLASRLIEGVAAGRFVLIGARPRPAWVPIFAKQDGPEGEEQKPKEEEEEDQWLEIELVDESTPPRPVPGARYVVELKDGTVLEGNLDEKGKARFEGIPKGATAKVSFPEIDAPQWK